MAGELGLDGEEVGGGEGLGEAGELSEAGLGGGGFEGVERELVVEEEVVLVGWEEAQAAEEGVGEGVGEQEGGNEKRLGEQQQQVAGLLEREVEETAHVFQQEACHWDGFWGISRW